MAYAFGTGLRAQPMYDVAVDPNAGPGELMKGLTQGVTGVSTGFQGAAAQALEPFAPTLAEQMFAEAQKEALDVAQQNPLRVQNFTDIQSAGDAADWAAGALGQGLPSTAAGFVGALGGRGLAKAMGRNQLVGSAAGSVAGMFPQEMGESAMDIHSDPAAMANTTPMSRLGLTAAKGGINAALESIVPTYTVDKMFSPGAIAKGIGGKLTHVGKQAGIGAAGEFLTEGTQQGVGDVIHHMANPEHAALDPTGMFNAGMAGAVSGGGMGAVGGVGGVAMDMVSPDPNRTLVDRVVDGVHAATGKAAEFYEKGEQKLQRLVERADYNKFIKDSPFFNTLTTHDETKAADPMYQKSKLDAADAYAEKVRSNWQGVAEKNDDIFDAAVKYINARQNGAGYAAADELGEIVRSVHRDEGKIKKLNAMAALFPEKKQNAQTPVVDLGTQTDKKVPLEDQKKFMDMWAAEFKKNFPTLSGIPGNVKASKRIEDARSGALASLFNFAKTGFTIKGDKDATERAYNALEAVLGDDLGDGMRSLSKMMFDQGWLNKDSYERAQKKANELGGRQQFDSKFEKELFDNIAPLQKPNWKSKNGLLNKVVGLEKKRRESQSDEEFNSAMSSLFGGNAEMIKERLADYKQQKLTSGFAASVDDEGDAVDVDNARDSRDTNYDHNITGEERDANNEKTFDTFDAKSEPHFFTFDGAVPTGSTYGLSTFSRDFDKHVSASKDAIIKEHGAAHDPQLIGVVEAEKELAIRNYRRNLNHASRKVSKDAVKKEIHDIVVDVENKLIEKYAKKIKVDGLSREEALKKIDAHYKLMRIDKNVEGEEFNIEKHELKGLRFNPSMDDGSATYKKGFVHLKLNGSKKPFSVHVGMLLGRLGNIDQSKITGSDTVVALRDKVMTAISSLIASSNRFTGEIGIQKEAGEEVTWLDKNKHLPDDFPYNATNTEGSINKKQADRAKADDRGYGDPDSMSVGDFLALSEAERDEVINELEAMIEAAEEFFGEIDFYADKKMISEAEKELAHLNKKMESFEEAIHRSHKDFMGDPDSRPFNQINVRTVMEDGIENTTRTVDASTGLPTTPDSLHDDEKAVWTARAKATKKVFRNIGGDAVDAVKGHLKIFMEKGAPAFINGSKDFAGFKELSPVKREETLTELLLTESADKKLTELKSSQWADKFKWYEPLTAEQKKALPKLRALAVRFENHLSSAMAEPELSKQEKRESTPTISQEEREAKLKQMQDKLDAFIKATTAESGRVSELKAKIRERLELKYGPTNKNKGASNESPVDLSKKSGAFRAAWDFMLNPGKMQAAFIIGDKQMSDKLVAGLKELLTTLPDTARVKGVPASIIDKDTGEVGSFNPKTINRWITQLAEGHKDGIKKSFFDSLGWRNIGSLTLAKKALQKFLENPKLAANKRREYEKKLASVIARGKQIAQDQSKRLDMDKLNDKFKTPTMSAEEVTSKNLEIKKAVADFNESKSNANDADVNSIVNVMDEDAANAYYYGGAKIEDKKQNRMEGVYPSRRRMQDAIDRMDVAAVEAEFHKLMNFFRANDADSPAQYADIEKEMLAATVEMTRFKESLKDKTPASPERVAASMAHFREVFNRMFSLLGTVNEQEVSQLSEEKKQELRLEIAKMVGGEVKVAFEDLGAVSGEWIKDPANVANMIKIALNAADHLGVARHEAMHEFFSMMRAAGANKMMDALTKVAKSGMIQKKLELLLKDHPAALAQLKDEEEAVAYMFQFYMSKELKLGPETATWFDKIKDFFGRVLNVMSREFKEQELAATIMDVFSNGGFVADREAAFKNIEEKVGAEQELITTGNRLFNALDKNKLLQNALYSNWQVLKSYDNPFLDRLSKMFHVAEGGKVGAKQAYLDASKQARHTYIAKLSELHRNFKLDEKEMEAATEYMIKETPTAQISHERIRKFVDGYRSDVLQPLMAYAREAGVSRWDTDTKSWKPMGNLGPFYYHIRWDANMVTSNAEEFRALLKKEHSKELADLVMLSREEGVSAEEANEEKVIDAIMNHMMATNGSDVGESSSSLGITPYASAVNKRTLGWIDHEKFMKFMDKNFLTNSTNYIVQMTKRAEYTRMFGNGGEKIQQMMDRAYAYKLLGSEKAVREVQAEIEKQRESLLKKYGTADRVKHHEMVESTIGDKTDEELQKDYDARAKRIKKFEGDSDFDGKDQLVALMEDEQILIKQELARRSALKDEGKEVTPLIPSVTSMRKLAEARLTGTAEEKRNKIIDTRNYMSTPTRAIMALEGTLGRDINPGLQKAMQGMTSYQNVRLLMFSLFTSFVDPAGIVVRGGEMKHAYQGFVRGMKMVKEGWFGNHADPDKLTNIATQLGITEAGIYHDILAETYGNSFTGSGIINKVNQALFRINGMEAWNRAMRIEATGAAIGFIMSNLKNPDQHTQRHLKEELGLDPAKADEYMFKPIPGSVLKGDHSEVGSLDYNHPAVRSAIMKWVDGAILNPNAAHRPIAASDPHYQLIYHLKQFTYSFHNVILRRVGIEMKHGNYSPMVAMMATYIPMIVAADAMRALLMPGEPPEWTRSLTGMLGHGLDRSGIGGIPQLVTDALPGIGKGHTAALFGPATDQMTGILMTPFSPYHTMSNELLAAMPAGTALRKLAPAPVDPDMTSPSGILSVIGQADHILPALGGVGGGLRAATRAI